MQLIRVNRDLRVDFFRGLALWWIFVDHIPGDELARLSLRNFALCDATEVFVLLAGYAAGLAYGRSLDRSGWLYAGADVVRRAWTLYIAHIFLFVIFSAQVAWSAATLDRADYLEEVHLDVLGDEPYRALLEALTLHFQPAYLNILPLYVVLLLLFAVALPLLRYPVVLAGCSVALYVAARALGINLPSWTGGGWFFNPLTWQLLFTTGAILSYAPGLAPRPRWWIDALAILVVIFGLVVLYVVWEHPELASRMPYRLGRVLFAVDKSGLHPMRLTSILALAWLAARLVPAGASWLSSRAAAPLVLAGQHSLPVFCTSIAVSFAGRLAMELKDDWAMQAAVNVLGAASLVAVGAVAAWYAQKGRARGTLPAAPRPDTA